MRQSYCSQQIKPSDHYPKPIVYDEKVDVVSNNLTYLGQ